MKSYSMREIQGDNLFFIVKNTLMNTQSIVLKINLFKIMMIQRRIIFR